MYAGLLALALPLQAQATTCFGRNTVKEAFDRAEHVFSGYVEGHSTGHAFDRDGVALAHLRVLQVWKGDLQPGQEVTTSAGDSVSFVSDGYVPQPQTAVLVYASGAPPFLLHACSNTRTLDQATGDIPQLNRLSEKPSYRGRR